MRSSQARLVWLTAVALAIVPASVGAARAADPEPAPNGGVAPAAPGTYTQTEIEGATRNHKPPSKGAASPPVSAPEAETQNGEVPQRIDPEYPRRRQATYDPTAQPPGPPPVRAPSRGPAPVT